MKTELELRDLQVHLVVRLRIDSVDTAQQMACNLSKYFNSRTKCVRDSLVFFASSLCDVDRN